MAMANPQPVMVFALTPAVAVQGVIDYNTSEGRKLLYGSAIDKL
jgi:hypothetical protein